ncbi:MAG TPA: Rrf2 family transcriptional regulator [Oligoflexia bacterium]|nr:Rrf2 family transcriptional regulator [Oligoflexia bacterium]HMP26735.1 Rrf2 family transcriptional regulator [Oligoflexia bacterium]
MRINQWVEFGVHCSCRIAEKTAKGAPISSSELANAIGIDKLYLHQILSKLRKAGIIKALRGPSGGFLLAKPANQISLNDIFVAEEGDSLAVICEHKPINKHRCKTDFSCYLKPIWFNLKNTVEDYLKSISLQDLIERKFSEGNQLVNVFKAEKLTSIKKRRNASSAR